MPFSRVKSSIRTLDILELLAEYPEGCSLSDISRELNIPVSSLHHLLSTMAERGYLIRNQRDNTFQLGLKIIDLHQAYLASTDLIHVAQSFMDRLRDQTGETSSLGVIQGNKVVYIHKRLAGRGIGVLDPAGTQKIAYATATGKAILSLLSDEEVDALYPDEQLPTLTPNTINSKSQLKRNLAEIRRNGYADEDGESKPGVWAVAAGILNYDGYPIAALSIVGPAHAITPENKVEWPSLVANAAAEISCRLGYPTNQFMRRGNDERFNIDPDQGLEKNVPDERRSGKCT